MPGRPLGSPAVMPTRCPGWHQPSSTTRARGVGDELLGRLVAAHRGGLHAPHQPAAPHGLAARARARRSARWAVRRDQAGRAPRQRRHDERVEVELARGDAQRCRRSCRRGRARRGARATGSTRGRGRPSRPARRRPPSSPPPRPDARRPPSPGRASRRRCRRGSRWRRRPPRRASGGWSVTIESSICVAVIDGRASSPASRSRRFCTSGTCSIGSSMPRSPRATITQSAARRIPRTSSTACGFSILAISGRRVCPRTNSHVLGGGARTTARRGRPRSTRRGAAGRDPPRAPTAASRPGPGMFIPWREAIGAADLDLGVDLARSRGWRRRRAGAPSRRRGRRSRPARARRRCPASSRACARRRRALVLVLDRAAAEASRARPTCSSTTPSRSAPMRSFGPGRSCRMATGRPPRPAASRTSWAVSACSSRLPWE